MIELSKCPNCSEDDRVTIAGKDFCMRCGTPAEDNAMMGVGDSTAVTNGQLPDTLAPINQQNQAPHSDAGSVQKFNSQPIITSHEMRDDLDQIEFRPPPRMESSSEPSNMVPPAVIGASAGPIATTEASMEQQPEPESNQQTAPTPVPTTTPGPTNLPIAAAMGTMSLDKRQAGVLSDDQFDQLKASVNTAVAQNSPNPNLNADILTHQAPAVNSTQTAVLPENSKPEPQDNHKKIAMASDIYSTPTNHNLLEDNNEDNNNDDKTDKSKGGVRKAAKPVAIAASIAALFVTGAYIWNINYPSLAFKIASAKSGISATMPGYIPAGYNLGGRIQTNPGTVSYSLLGDSKDSRISVTQTKTDWDSQALAENYVAPKAENYLALQAQGLTIYILGKDEATWVNKGTWYKLDSKGQDLNQDQIIKIATSL